jgi:hypothetical protein
MFRCSPVLLLTLTLGSPCALAQNPRIASTATAKSETFLGLRLGAVPEVLYDHIPALRRGSGILVERITLSSPADKAGLKRHDLILSYNGSAVKDTEQLATLIRADKPENKAALVVIRGGKEVTLEVSLVEACRAADTLAVKNPRGTAKYGRPPAVNVICNAVGAGKMEVTFAFIPEGKTKERRVTYTGSLDQIEEQVHALPPPVQDLAKVAINRLRSRSAK